MYERHAHAHAPDGRVCFPTRVEGIRGRRASRPRPQHMWLISRLGGGRNRSPERRPGWAGDAARPGDVGSGARPARLGILVGLRPRGSCSGRAGRCCSRPCSRSSASSWPGSATPGPTVDGISTTGCSASSPSSSAAASTGWSAVLPMVVAAAYGAALARRSADGRARRRLRSRIGLYLRRGVTALRRRGRRRSRSGCSPSRRASRRSATRAARSCRGASRRWRRCGSTARISGSRSAPGARTSRCC